MIAIPRKKKKTSTDSPCLMEIRIELAGSQPRVWRRIRIDGRSSFAALHHVIQAAMGWHDAHLHQFRIGQRYIGVPDPKNDAPEWHTEDESALIIGDLIATGSRFTYLYDFGDGWEHHLSVEWIDDNDGEPLAQGDAWVVEGENACPPENIGGMGAFQDFLDKLENEPYADETKEMREWVGLDYDPARFDRQAANAAIKRLLWNHWIK